MRINNNISSINTHRMLGLNTSNSSKNMEKLSSGYRVNRAGDDAAGLAISEKMRTQIRGLNMASRNSLDAISLVQVTEGGMQVVHSLLQRIRELTVQAANDTNTHGSTSDRAALQLEIDQLMEEIIQVKTGTTFNSMKVLDGAFADQQEFIPVQAGGHQSGVINYYHVYQSWQRGYDARMEGATRTENPYTEIIDSIAQRLSYLDGSTGATTIYNDYWNALYATNGALDRYIAARNVLYGGTGADTVGTYVQNPKNQPTDPNLLSYGAGSYYQPGTGLGTVPPLTGTTPATAGVGGLWEEYRAALVNYTNAFNALEVPWSTFTSARTTLENNISAYNTATTAVQASMTTYSANRSTLEANLTTYNDLKDVVAALALTYNTNRATVNTDIAAYNALRTSTATLATNYNNNRTALENAVANYETALAEYESTGGSPTQTEIDNYTAARNALFGGSFVYVDGVSGGIPGEDREITLPLGSGGGVWNDYLISREELFGDGLILSPPPVFSDNAPITPLLPTEPTAGALGSAMADYSAARDKLFGGTYTGGATSVNDNQDIHATQGSWRDYLNARSNLFGGSYAPADVFSGPAAITTGAAGSQMAAYAAARNALFGGTYTAGAASVNSGQAVHASQGSWRAYLTGRNALFGTAATVPTGTDRFTLDSYPTPTVATGGTMLTYANARNALFGGGPFQDNVVWSQVGVAPTPHATEGSWRAYANARNAVFGDGFVPSGTTIPTTPSATMGVAGSLMANYTAARSAMYGTTFNTMSTGTLAAQRGPGNPVVGAGANPSIATTGSIWDRFRVAQNNYSNALNRPMTTTGVDIGGTTYQTPDLIPGAEYGYNGARNFLQAAITERNNLREELATLVARQAGWYAGWDGCDMRYSGGDFNPETDISSFYTFNINVGVTPTPFTIIRTNPDFSLDPEKMQIAMQVGANERDVMGMFIADIHRVLGYLGDDYYARDHDFFTPNNPLTTPSSGWVTFNVNQDSAPAISELIGRVDGAINYVSTARAKLGAYQNRLEHKIANLDNTAENLQASESRIRDADMAKMMTELTRNNILVNASTAMLSQANNIPQMVLSLIA